MFKLSSVVMLAACLQVITSEGPPELPPECRGKVPKGDTALNCCKIPPIGMFKESDFKECHAFSASPEKACEPYLCLLGRINFLKDGDIDQEAVSAFFDKYAETNEALKPVVEIAKKMCLKNDLPGPPDMCHARKVMLCIDHTLVTECPAWEETASCKVVKENIEKCKKPYE